MQTHEQIIKKADTYLSDAIDLIENMKRGLSSLPVSHQWTNIVELLRDVEVLFKAAKIMSYDEPLHEREFVTDTVNDGLDEVKWCRTYASIVKDWIELDAELVYEFHTSIDFDKKTNERLERWS